MIELKHKPRKNCIVCNKEIYRAGRFTKVKTKGKRAYWYITCSHECSVTYCRIRSYVDYQIRVGYRRLNEEYKS